MPHGRLDRIKTPSVSHGWKNFRLSLSLCFACCYKRSERSSAVYKVRGLDENTDESNMKSCRTQRSRIRAKLGLMTVSASMEEKWGARVTRDRGRKRKRACNVYAMPVYATPPSASPGTWMKWMNDGPGPQKRPSSIEAEQSIHGDEWGVNTNNNNNNSDIGGPYSYFSFIHMYVVTQTHTYGPNTMDIIPLGTPPESSWEQGCLTKHRGKGASTVQAWKKKSPGIMSMQSAQWSGMRGHRLLSAISTLSGNPTAPSAREARKPHVPRCSPPLRCWPSPSQFNQSTNMTLSNEPLPMN